MGKFIRNVFKTKEFTLTELNTGYYLWDSELQMNVSMHEKTEQDALLYALTYYQKKLKTTKAELKDIKDKVNHFVSQFTQQEE